MHRLGTPFKTTLTSLALGFLVVFSSCTTSTLKKSSMAPQDKYKAYFHLLTVRLTFDQVTSGLLSEGQKRLRYCRSQFKTRLEVSNCLRLQWMAYQSWVRVIYPRLADRVLSLYILLEKDKKKGYKETQKFVCKFRKNMRKHMKRYLGGTYDSVMKKLRKLDLTCPEPKKPLSDGVKKTSLDPSHVMKLPTAPKPGVVSWSKGSPKIRSVFGM